IYIGPEGVLTGSARIAQEARERDAAMQEKHEAERRSMDFARRRRRIQGQIEELQAQLADESAELDALKGEGTARDAEAADALTRMGESRRVAARPSKA